MNTPAIDGLLQHIERYFGSAGETDARILRWADLAAKELKEIKEFATKASAA